MNATSQAYRGSRMALGFTGVLLLAACASTPPAPTANLQAAQQAIAAAERSEAARYAPGELSEAHTKLALADTAVTERKMVVAEHFADPPKLSPNSEMPAYKFNEQDLKAITDYVMAIPK